MASVCGISMAAPRPWTARKPISQREPAGRRGGREHHDPGHEHGPRAQQIPEPPRRDHQDGEHQRVGVEHPQHGVQGGVQPVDHVGDGDVDDRQVEQRHEEAE
jgi:hypothetical protein